MLSQLDGYIGANARRALQQQKQKSHVSCAHTHTALTAVGVGSHQATLPRVYDHPPQSALNDRLSLLQNLEHLVDVIRWRVVGTHSSPLHIPETFFVVEIR